MSNLLATPLQPFGDGGGRAEEDRDPLFRELLDSALNSAPRDDSRERFFVTAVPVACTTAIVGNSPTPSFSELADRVIGDLVVLSVPSRVRLITSILRYVRYSELRDLALWGNTPR